MESNEVKVTDAAIAKALQLAKAESKKALKGDTTSEGADRPKRVKLTQEQKDARDAERKAAAEARKAEREAKKAAKPERKPAHMAKVEKAAENLPELNETATNMVDDIMNNLGTGMAQAIVAHLKHALRVKATANAAETKLEEGQLVRIIRSDEPKNIGLLGRVKEARRIRVFVQPLGLTRVAYLFNSDVEVVTDATVIEEANSVFPVTTSDTQVA